MKAIWNGTVVAESDDTVVIEGNHYFPASAVKREYLLPSNTKTMCAWKGEARYHTLFVDGDANPDAAWYYAEPRKLPPRSRTGWLSGRVCRSSNRVGGPMAAPMSPATAGLAVSAGLGAAHRRRLHDVWRSAGWPCHDPIEIDLLAAGLVSRHWDLQGRETLRVTDAGIQWLAAARRRSQAARGAHEALVDRVAAQMQQAGRVVWRTLSLRAPLRQADGSTRWAVAMPDVFSIRHTTLEQRVEPIVHEIKVSRADLLSDLRRGDKAAAYLALSGQCWYVLREGIAEADEIPQAYGVMVAREAGLHVERPAPQRPMRLPLAVWMALARAACERQPEEPAQGLLGFEHSAAECWPGSGG